MQSYNPFRGFIQKSKRKVYQMTLSLSCLVTFVKKKKLYDEYGSIHKPNSGSIVMGAHWNTQNTSKYTCILMYFAYSNGLPSQYCHHYINPPTRALTRTLNYILNKHSDYLFWGCGILWTEPYTPRTTGILKYTKKDINTNNKTTQSKNNRGHYTRTTPSKQDGNSPNNFWGETEGRGDLQSGGGRGRGETAFHLIPKTPHNFYPFFLFSFSKFFKSSKKNLGREISKLGASGGVVHAAEVVTSAGG